MKVLVTGGAGFIGSHLTEQLVERGYEVTVLDDFSNGLRSNLANVKNEINIIAGDVSNLLTVMTLASDVDTIYHLATRCLVQGIEDPHTMHKVNDLGTYNICLAAKEHSCKIVYINSSEVYGNQESYPISEKAPLHPRSIYGLTKAIGEKYVLWHHKMYQVPAVSLRVFNTYGPRHREDSYAAVITAFMKQLKEGKPLEIHGSGSQSREFTYVSDVVRAIMLISDKLSHGEIVNVGSEQEISILELADLVFKTYNWPIYKKLRERGMLDKKYKLCPARPNDLQRLCANITYARTLGYEPKVGINTGLYRYVKWFKEKYK